MPSGKRLKETATKTATAKAELDVVSEIKKTLPTYKADYIFYLYSKECLSFEPKQNTFEELKAHSEGFPSGATERTARQWLLSDDMQVAIKMLLERVNTQRMNELYSLYSEKAKTDTNALKQLLELNKVLFADKSDSELTKILNNIGE